MVLVDTNVLVDVLQADPEWAAWSLRQLQAQSQIHELWINPVIYAELSMSFETREALDRMVLSLNLKLHEIPKAALFLAGKAYLKYRRQGGTKAQVLPDFFIGAHAAVQQMALLTRDASRFKTYFPSLQVIAPN